MSISPQLRAAAPAKDCPKCGRPMQLVAVTPSTYSYACYAHTEQNAGTFQTFYLNVHHTIKLGEDGKIAVKEGK